MSLSSPPFPVVGIGASAGGLQAFLRLLEKLPSDTRMAYVLIPHLDPSHESILSSILSRKTPMEVHDVRDGLPLEPDHVYVIRPNTIMTVSHGVLRTESREGHSRRHDCIDHFLISLAEDRKALAIGVILSGTASDGSAGVRAVKAEGGITFAQDDSAQFQDMPRNAVATGAVDLVLSPERIAEELAAMSRHPHLSLALPRATLSEPPRGDAFAEILRILAAATGVDFSHYKEPTLRRRISRRMALRRAQSFEAYVRELNEHPEEARALHDEILIHVTSFFREPEAFETLRRDVFPALTRARGPQEPLRVWVPGCSTGEETYSLAIALSDYLSENGKGGLELQVFGTDVSERAVERARAGVYDRGVEAEVGAERLRRHFNELEGGRVQIRKSIRDRCVFARQDLARDPPFSRIDLLSCRNVLIYLDKELQRSVFPSLHYALKPGGFLLLGASETAEGQGRLFAPLDKKARIYVKVAQTLPLPLDGGFARIRAAPRPSDGAPGERVRASIEEPDIRREADRTLLAEFAPASIVVTEAEEVVDVRGDTSAYLTPAPGRPGFTLRKLVREDLLPELSSAIKEARSTGKRARRAELCVRGPERDLPVGLEVVPLAGPASRSRYFLVLFHPGAAVPAPLSPAVDAGEDPRDREIARLRQERTDLRDYQEAISERAEAAHEELRSAHEEVLSANEELQSTNEELQTSKEELQSANEELATLNEELEHRNLELGELNSDLTNVLASLNIPLAIIDGNLRLRRYTPMAERLLNAIPGDINRRITDLHLKVDIPDLENLLRRVLDTLEPLDQEVRDAEGRWYSLRVRPYRNAENRIDGAVLVLIEIDALKREIAERSRAEDELRRFNFTLEERVEGRTADLKEAVDELEAFSYSVSHDLRAPLRAMNAYSEMILAEYAGRLLDEAGQDYARKISTAARRMDQLVQDLVEYARLSRAQIRLEAINLNELMGEVLRELAPDFRGLGAEVSVQERLDDVVGHRPTLAMALGNLLSNAVKFVSPGTAPRISVRSERRPARVRLWVEDNGIGIAPEHHERIFGVFQRLNRQEDFPGTGIGLAIVRKAVERMGGQVAVESAAGKGSRFWIDLPTPENKA